MKTERRAVKKNHFIPKYLHLRAICPQFWELNHTTEVCSHKPTHIHTHCSSIYRVWRELDTRMMSSEKAAGVFEEIPSSPALCTLDSGGPLISSTASVCVCVWPRLFHLLTWVCVCFCNTPQALFHAQGTRHFPLSLSFFSSFFLFWWSSLGGASIMGKGGMKRKQKSKKEIKKNKLHLPYFSLLSLSRKHSISLWSLASTGSLWLDYNRNCSWIRWDDGMNIWYGGRGKGGGVGTVRVKKRRREFCGEESLLKVLSCYCNGRLRNSTTHYFNQRAGKRKRKRKIGRERDWWTRERPS